MKLTTFYKSIYNTLFLFYINDQCVQLDTSYFDQQIL